MNPQRIDDPDTLLVERVLKQDLFGRVELVRLPAASGGGLATRRVLGLGRRPRRSRRAESTR